MLKATNKKVKNATPTEYNGIKFKSILETRIYKYLLSKGIEPEYEKIKIKLWSRSKGELSVPYYDRIGKIFKKVTSKPLSVTYTPDFIFKYNGYTVYLEVKGFKNDVVPYKIRLFRDWLEAQNNPKQCYAVVHTIKEVEFLLNDLNDSNEKSV